jgi:hypothetical protein
MQTVAATRSKAALLREIDDLQIQVAHLNHENYRLKRDARRWYEKNRKLENAIRSSFTDWETGTPFHQIMLNLVHRIPRYERKKR